MEDRIYPENQDHLLARSIKCILLGVLMMFGMLYSFQVHAQVPVNSNGTPAESFLGEQFCFDTQFTNVGSPGFGPYMQLVIPTGLKFDGATIFGTSAIIDELGVFPAVPGNQIIDPLSDLPVTGPEGGTLTTIKLPVGSVVAGGPNLTTNICLTIESFAVVGTPLPVMLVPVYEFGDTATGVNGPIVGTANTQPVTPTVIRFEKANGAPEDIGGRERPPSTTWPISYTLTADIANTATVTDMVFSDVLPNDMQFVGPVTITGGTGCVVTATPSVIVPGGNLVVDCTSATGTTNASDVTVSYPAYLTDFLDETSCGTFSRTNSASLDVEYQMTPLPQLSDDSIVIVKHVALQKAATTNTAIPGATIDYSLSFQVSDSADVNALVVTDTLPDGTLWGAHGSLLINGSPVAIVPDVTLNVDGTTTVIYDIGAAASPIGGGSDISLSYTADIQQSYISTGLPVLASDTLNNSVDAVYSLVQGAVDCVEDSDASVGIRPVSLTKTIQNLQPFYVPGEIVTFQLELTVPSGDTRNVQFRDALPLPVFNVADISIVWGVDIRLAPTDNLGLTPTSITRDLATNTIVIDWPDISSDTARVLAVEIDATVTDDPFADNLFLTNIAESSTNNTPNLIATDNAIVQLLVGAPELVITKGISASTNPNSVISPAPSVLPVDGDISNSDAQDILTYVLTVENIGSASAFDVRVNENVPAGLSACVLVSVVDGNGDALATDSGDLFNAGLVITELTGNDGIPVGGGAPYSSDTAIISFTCVVDIAVQPLQQIDNEASAVWASQPGTGNFQAVTDIASTTIANVSASKLFVATSEATTSDAATPPRATIGEIIRYRLVAELPEGTVSNLNLSDTLPGGLTFLDDGTSKAAFISNGGGITSTAQTITNISGNDPSLAAVASSLVVSDVSATTANFAFGTVVNSDNDADAEFLIVEFNVLVNNSVADSNDTGEDRINYFEIFNDVIPLGTSNDVQVRIAEPGVTVNKNASPTAGDAGDVITFTVVVSNSTGGNVSSAFDVQISDPLDPRLVNFVVTSITPLACPALGELNSSTATLLDISFAEMAPGCSVTVVYSSELDGLVAPGDSITNTATAAWTSLPGPSGTINNPTGSSTPGTPGSDNGERDDSDGQGGTNDYTQSADASVVVQSVVLNKAVTGTSQLSTGTDKFRTALDDLTIGETVDFEIIATIPEGTTPQVLISDTMPWTNGVMEIISATVVSVGTNLTTALTPLSPANLLDLQLSDGINDSASFDFGQVVNTADGVNDVNDEIRVSVTGRLRNLAPNQSGDLLTNTALVQFGTGLNASSSAQVDTVAPVLAIIKSGDITQGDAGDTVTFTLTISHPTASTADAFEVLLGDNLPAGLTLVGSTLASVSGLAPDALIEDIPGNGFSAGWVSFGLSQTSVLTFEATIDPVVMPSEVITNTATVDWTSLPGDGDPDDRQSSASDDHGITITAPGLTKVITGTSEVDTGTGQFGPETDLTIGEEVTYQFTVVLPEGSPNGVVVTDQLPTGSSVLQVVSSSLVSIGSNISGAGLPVAGSPGVASGTNADTFNDRVVWTLGNLVNTPDGADTAADQLLFEVVAVVLDQPANQSGVVAQTNTATVVSSNSSASGTVDVELVAPALTLEKVVSNPVSGFVDAGDTVTHTLTIDHTVLSTADAYNVVINDTLPGPELLWADNVVSTCPGLLVDDIGEPLIVFTIPNFELLTDSCTINYDTTVAITAQPAQTLTNTAGMEYDSTPVFVDGVTRRLTASGTAEVTVLAPTLVKVATVSNVADTGSSQFNPALPDLAIGETITYELTIVVPEGTVPNAIVTDLMPALPPGAGFIEAIGASVSAVGGNISTSLPGTPVLDDFQVIDGLDDRVIFDFGTITNIPDGVSDEKDRIVMQVVGRVANVADNANGDLLVNTASFDFTGGSLADDADVEVVEPVLNLTKSMGPVVDTVVRLSLVVENTGSGTAPAYDINVTDVLEDSVWNSAALSQVSVSTGFLLQATPGPAAGQTTITLSSDPLAISPAGTIPVGSSVSAVFDIPLAALPPVPNPVVNLAELDQADTLPGDDPAQRDLPPDSDIAEIGIPDLQLSKDDSLLLDLDSSGDVSPGDTLRYTLVINNQGAGDATNIVLEDAPDIHTALLNGSVVSTQGSVAIGNNPGDTTIEVAVGTIVAATSVTVTYDVVINQPLPSGVTEVVNQALLTSAELPPVISDDPDEPGTEDPTIVPINAQPDLVISKDDGDVTAVPGGTVSYLLSYQNVGNQDATGVVITETVPLNTLFNGAASTPGWACLPDATAGSTCTLALGGVAASAAAATATFAVMVDDPLPTGVAEILNTVGIADDGTNGDDPTPDDNTDSDSTPVDAFPDLVISKDDGDVTAVPGGTVSYLLSYQNVGNQDATGVVITETVPLNTVFDGAASTPGWACLPDATAGSTCTLAIGGVAAGVPAATATFAVMVDDPLPTGVTEVLNTVGIADDGTNGDDPTPDDNTDSDSTPVDAVPDLVISKDDGGVSARPGSTLSYTLSYQNVGDQDATGVVITETVPAGTEFIADDSTPGWVCLPDGMADSTCTLAIGDVAAGSSVATVIYTVLIAQQTDATKGVLNITSIADDGSNGDDPTPDNNTDNVITFYYVAVPILNQYGIAILALLMLGVGLVGFRRYI
ncbi:MAG: hypothetical protein QNK19_07490 [Xanthomonadales bacterium]|nr:hypothetical protein [Xanthomonadales bacterium]